MKKIIGMFAALVLCFVFVACSSSTPEAENNKEAFHRDDESIQSESEEKVEFEKITVVDNEYCFVEITEAELGKSDTTIKILIENKTSDKNQMFTIESATINGVDVDPLWATDVAAGKKSNETILLNLSDLEKEAIEKVTDIQLDFRVYDYDDWLADDFATESVHIYPYGEDKVEKYIRSDEETDIVLVDNDNVKVVALGVDPDDLFGYEVLVYIENKTDSSAMVSAESVSVNGFMCDPFWAREVPAAAVSFTSIQWFDTTLEEAGVESIDDVEMTIKAYNSDSWSDSYAEVVVSFKTNELPIK